MFKYFGNGAYCYANSASMLLSSIGENILPSLIEPLTGVGLSASLRKDGENLYFNNQALPPDLGITKALDILGFKYEVDFEEDSNNYPKDRLNKVLKEGPAILGPLDMGYLVYNPSHEHLYEADHFIFAYKTDEKYIYLHDPAGFPYMFIAHEEFKKAWKAESTSYAKGHYRYIYNPKRISNPSSPETYEKATEYFKELYKRGKDNDVEEKYFVGAEAIKITSEKIKSEGISDKLKSHFIYFALPLGAKRSLDYATFFDSFDEKVSELKNEKAVLFGHAHTYTVLENKDKLSATLDKLAEVESKIGELLIK